MDKITLVDALRCSASPFKEHLDCDKCPYQVLERIDKMELPPDRIIDGVGYWMTCDCEQMALDAANEIVKTKIKLVSANNKIQNILLGREDERTS